MVVCDGWAVPLPVAPALLPTLVKELPRDAPQHVGWCLVVPTDECVRATLKQMMAPATKEDKPSATRQLISTVLVPAIEKQAVEPGNHL